MFGRLEVVKRSEVERMMEYLVDWKWMKRFEVMINSLSLTISQ